MAAFIRPHQTRASDLRPQWHVIDAEGKTLGRLGTEIAKLLQGKHNPMYVPNLNTGDFVVVINAEKVRVTGNKLNDKMYYRHSGYHGGLREQTLSDVLKRTPTRVLRQAVKGMLPKNSVGRQMLSRLKLYTGNEHPHNAQVNAGIRSRLVDTDAIDAAAVQRESKTTTVEDASPESKKSPRTKSRRAKAKITTSEESATEGKALDDSKPAKQRVRRQGEAKAKTSEDDASK